MTSTTVLARSPGDPVPDLLDYRVVHRAMTVDLDRLAGAAAELVHRPDTTRLTALRHYLRAVSAEIESHHHVEDDHVWPLLEAVAAEPAALLPLTDDHHRLDPLLHRANDLAARDEASPELAAVLREMADLLTGHVADEERDVFPLITEHVRVEDYRRLQQRFRGNLKPRMLPFVVPWVISHATPEERPALLARAGWPLRVLNAVFAPRFRARAALLFGGLSRRDRRVVRIMRLLSRVHVAVHRRSSGRLARRWFGGSELVLLTTVGRRTGTPRTVTLMALRDGADFIVAASHGGVDREPPWWLNLRANPRAELEVSGERVPVTAEVVSEAERPAVWARLVGAYQGFEAYQAGVRRRIAVVRLRRRTDTELAPQPHVRTTRAGSV
jgi:deazaflavin-dependent oxidoreductase (nitroreductase family)